MSGGQASVSREGVPGLICKLPTTGVSVGGFLKELLPAKRAADEHDVQCTVVMPVVDIRRPVERINRDR